MHSSKWLEVANKYFLKFLACNKDDDQKFKRLSLLQTTSGAHHYLIPSLMHVKSKQNKTPRRVTPASLCPYHQSLLQAATKKHIFSLIMHILSKSACFGAQF
ncbi:hypothetical protein Hanom_Chr08g00729121 [Helianthus anomalus]